MTAQFHAVRSPRMTLDSEAHPGMAGWVFEEEPDDGDVLDIVDEHGARTYIDMAELYAMVGAGEESAEAMEESAEAMEESALVEENEEPYDAPGP